MSIKNWLRRKLKCYHVNLHARFHSYHTGDDRHTRDGIGAVYVQTKGVCPDCKAVILQSIRLPNNLRDLFWSNYNECMQDDPAVIANEKRKES